MSGEVAENESLTAEERRSGAAELPITIRLVGTAMLGGVVGMVLMLPLLVGAPLALGLFRTAPIVEFSSIVSFFGLQPSLALGVVIFVLGGSTLLPVQFLVVGGFLPPESPRYLRGASFTTAYWFGFLFAFWPGGGAVTIGIFVVVSLVSHWIYGLSLGYLLDRWAEIPQHDV
jgi:F0F1-type ATP synthase assembly protein I